MLVHVNGRLVPESEASISVFDRGFLFGDAVFESMRAVAGTVFRLERHVARLRRSAEGIGLEALPPPATIGAGVAGLLRGNALLDARIRVTVTRGPGRPGDYLDAPGPPNVVMSATPFTGLDPVHHERGVAIAVPRRRQIPPAALDPSIKSTSRLNLVLARREARAQGGFEAVLLDADGCLTEGTASNFFLAATGRLFTPPVPEGVLPGVTREVIIVLARAAGIDVAEEPIPASRLLDAEEVFLTNTSWEVLPVVSVDGRSIGGGRPGPMARDLLRRYRDLLRRECGGG
ncbi:MAG TPA: aminotransferase class IV [Candidatus Polarisedimenticolia bacterium]|nr:aminotransferase class IV [Candidatus Polarisedimenticolia bacterium]